MIKQFFAVAAIIAIACAQCTRVPVSVTNADELFDALNNAKPGMDILLAPGKYLSQEKMPLLTKKGGDKDCPITISCDTYGAAFVYGTFQIMNCSYVTVRNLAISHWTRVLLSNNILLENLYICDADASGAEISYSSQITMRNCTFDNTDLGLDINHSEDVVAEGCTFASIISQAVEIENSNRNTITDCAFNGSGYLFGGDSWMTIQYDSDYNMVSNNYFCNPDKQKMASGVNCLSGTNNVFKNNFMVINEDVYGFHFNDTKQKVCISNKVIGGMFTDGTVDKSC